MLIGIDMSLTAEPKTGLQSYARSLVTAMADVGSRHDYLLYPFVAHSFPEDYRRAFCPDRPNFRVARRRVPKWIIEKLWDSKHIDNGTLAGGDPDVYFSPFHSVPPRSYRRLVCVFHDVSFRIHPEFATQENIDHCEHNFERARACADKIVTVSHFAKSEIVKHMGVPEDWIAVTQEAAAPIFRPVANARIPERMRRDIGEPESVILCVGSIQPRKNLVTLIRAYDRILQRGRCKPVLILAGGVGWQNSEIYAEIEKRGLVDKIYFCGQATDEELLQLYNSVTVLVYPSLYEGFGLPVVEAMSCGTPVVVTRAASLPEVGGNGVEYVEDPRDDDEMSRCLERVIRDPALRADLRQRGPLQAQNFSWERTARETLAVLEEVHGDPAYRRRGVEMGKDERALVVGWHPIEFDNGRWFRWTRRRGTLRMLRGKGDLVVHAATAMPGRGHRLKVRVDGVVLGHGDLRQEWGEFRFRLDERIRRDGEVDITLSVNHLVPKAERRGDDRTLGARVASVTFA